MERALNSYVKKSTYTHLHHLSERLVRFIRFLRYVKNELYLDNWADNILNDECNEFEEFVFWYDKAEKDSVDRKLIYGASLNGNQSHYQMKASFQKFNTYGDATVMLHKNRTVY